MNTSVIEADDVRIPFTTAQLLLVPLELAEHFGIVRQLVVFRKFSELADIGFHLRQTWPTEGCRVWISTVEVHNGHPVVTEYELHGPTLLRASVPYGPQYTYELVFRDESLA